MSQFTSSSSLHIITASAKNTKSVKLYRSRRLAEVTHTLPVHLKKGVNVVELRGVSAKIVNKLVMPVACSFQDPDAQPPHQFEHMANTRIRLTGIQPEGSTIRITVVSDSIYRQDVFVSYYLGPIPSWDPYSEFHAMTTASPKGRTLPSIVTIHRCAIFEKHTGENWDGEKFPVIIADGYPPPLATVAEATTSSLSTTVATSILKFTWNVVSGILGIAEAHAGELPLALRAPAPGGGLFQSCQLPPLSGNGSATPRRNEDNDSNMPLLVTPGALQPRDGAAASRWNREYAGREVVLIAVMSFPAQYERVLSLNDFTTSIRGGPAITVECTIHNMWEDVLTFPEGSPASIFVDGKRVDVKGPQELYPIRKGGSRTFSLGVDRKLPVEYTITFPSLETSSHRASTLGRPDLLHTDDDPLELPAEHISATISNENPFPVSGIILRDVVSGERPLKSLICTTHWRSINCIDPAVGFGDRVVLPSIPAHAEILLDIEWFAC
ncbi:hypothetical protein C8Q74DRAFT_1367010 [Fomes fomentarius]|nr:hypothetical protein C8Q74DRAFT_1367010 [Fomes fomentarius]